MAELEVDQTNLPAVQEVSQYFALLEDGALAHNLQEQEIEQYYSGNIQRSQLVQKDIRVAKRLQDEEQQRAHMLHRQTTRRLEEQDSEYARRIQEEIQQAAEELQRREDEDKEIAKQIQEEEALLVRQRNSYRRTDSGGPRRNRTSLDLSELQQVLQDEELACRLQAEEEKLLRGGPTILPHLQSAYPEGDFRVAQVAQDEEIARFMQKQEIKSQLHSRELEDCGSGQGCREMSPVYDNRYTHDREMRRERMDSARPGFTADECSEEFQSPIPIPLAAQQQHHRNIAEQLDPTFHREENIQAVWDISGTSQASLNEEPPFVAPTKRQSDKSGRMKSKEKKDNVKEKQKESCKQQ